MSKEKDYGLGFHSKNSLKFKRYLDVYAPPLVRTLMASIGYSSDTLYRGIINAFRNLKRNDADRADIVLIEIWSLLIADRKSLKQHALQAYQRLIIAGADYAVADLVDVLDREGSKELYIKLQTAFPRAPFLHQEFARYTQNRMSARSSARRSVGAKTKNIDETKQEVIRQWIKFLGDKSTAASFANKFCEGVDAGAKPDVFHDVVTGQPLQCSTVTNRTVRKWINEYKAK